MKRVGRRSCVLCVRWFPQDAFHGTEWKTKVAPRCKECEGRTLCNSCNSWKSTEEFDQSGLKGSVKTCLQCSRVRICHKCDCRKLLLAFPASGSTLRTDWCYACQNMRRCNECKTWYSSSMFKSPSTAKCTACQDVEKHSPAKTYTCHVCTLSKGQDHYSELLRRTPSYLKIARKRTCDTCVHHNLLKEREQRRLAWEGH